MADGGEGTSDPAVQDQDSYQTLLDNIEKAALAAFDAENFLDNTKGLQK